MAQPHQAVPAATSRAQPLHRRPRATPVRGQTAFTAGLRRGRAKFLRYFPKGFRDPLYEDWERGYKWKAHQRWNETLGKASFRKLLQDGKHREIAAYAVAIEAAQTCFSRSRRWRCVMPSSRPPARGPSRAASMTYCMVQATLVNASIDFITAGQAFHWFDRERSRAEFARILKPNGWVVLMWNGFRVETSPLNNAYQQLVLKYGTDYQAVRREIIGCDIESFYAPGACQCARFEFQQGFDFEGLKGRLLSSSYAPEPDHPHYQPMLGELQEIFNTNQKDGKIFLHYETELYYGRLSAK
jgi:hypothetical protein